MQDHGSYRSAKSRNESEAEDSYSKSGPIDRSPIDSRAFDCMGQRVYLGPAYHEHVKSKFLRDVGRISEQKLLNPKRIIDAKPSYIFTEYRCHIKYAVRSFLNDGAPSIKFGLFSPGTHEVMDTVNCPTQYPSINKVLFELKEDLIEHQITGYDEESHQGTLRYLCIRASHLTDELMVTFVVTDLKEKLTFKKILQDLRHKGHNIAGGYLDLNTKPGNHIFGFDLHHLLGKRYLRESLDQLQFEISPTSFFQINPWQAQNIYLRICELIGPPTDKAKTVWDLYGGIGQIGMFLARLGYKVHSVEEIESASEDANRNAKINHLEKKFHSLSGKTEDITLELLSEGRPDVIVANPSRRGLDKPTVDRISECVEQGSLFFYLSCDLETMIRDLKLFKESGYKLLQMEAFDMMPHTEHLEWLGVVKK